MKFSYERVSERYDQDEEKKEIEINTLEELMEFIDKVDEEIIINREKNEITIFDDYL